MNIPLDTATRHCQALAEIHSIGRAYLTDDTATEDDAIAAAVEGLWDNTVAIVFSTYFSAIEATPSERAELGL